MFSKIEDCKKLDNKTKDYMETYCGNLNVTLPNIIQFTNYNGFYGSKNIFCIYELQLSENGKIASSYSANFTSATFYNSSARLALIMNVGFEQLDKDISLTQIRSRSLNVQDAITTKLYVYLSERVNFNPFSFSVQEGLNIQDSSTGSDTSGISIAVGTLVGIAVTSSFITSVLVFRARARALRLRNNQLRDRRVVGSDGVFVVNHNADANLNEAQIKERNKNYVDKMLEEEFAVNDYKEDINYFKTNCTICLESFVEHSKIIKLHCKHVFHFNCIKLALHNELLNPRCPNCNIGLLSNNVISTSNFNPIISPNINNNNQRLELLTSRTIDVIPINNAVPIENANSNIINNNNNINELNSQVNNNNLTNSNTNSNSDNSN